MDGFILHNGRIFIPASSTLWPQILATAHGAGHEGVQKTLHRLSASFYNANANKLVREFILGCATCQRNKWEHLHPAGLLQPLPVPSAVWQDIAMDFVEGFPRVGGKSVVLTVVDPYWDTRTRQRRWRGRSSTRLYDYMASRAPSSATATPSSPARSGRSCSSWPASSCISAPRSTPRRTGSRR